MVIYTVGPDRFDVIILPEGALPGGGGTTTTPDQPPAKQPAPMSRC